VQKSKLQFHYGDKIQVMHLHCGDTVQQYMLVEVNSLTGYCGNTPTDGMTLSTQSYSEV